MDFFGILFDMKNGKKIPYSKNYFDTLFAENLAGVTTLTGTLPLTFTTSETALRSWTIYGNNTPHIATSTGVLPLTFTAKGGTVSDWVIEGNDDAGENLINVADFTVGVAETHNVFSGILPAGTYTAAVYQNTALTSAERNTLVILKTSGAIYESANTNYHLAAGWHYLTFTIAESENVSLRYWTANASNSVDCTSVMLVKGSTAPDHFIPYQRGVGEQRVDGYYAPLTISQAGQPDKNYDIFIGDAPLTEGETVSKTSTGVDIELFEGENTISTTLYNKPETAISYVDYLGVGEKSGNDWQIPLTISDGTNTTSVNVPIDAPLTEGQSVTDTLTINTVEGENTIDTTLENKPKMKITYKGG